MIKLGDSSKVLKNLSIAVLLTSSLFLGGCGSEKAEKPKEETASSSKAEDSKPKNEIEYIDMSPEETKALKLGQSIPASGKAIKNPDRKILEQMGLDYEIVIRVREWDKNGNSHLSENEIHYTTAEIGCEFIHVKTDEEEYEFVLDSINIIPIAEVYQDNDKLFKKVKLSDGTIPSLEILDKANFEILQQLLAE